MGFASEEAVQLQVTMDPARSGQTGWDHQGRAAGRPGGGGIRRRARVLPDLSPAQLHALLAESGRGEPREYRVSVDAFHDLMSGGTS